MHSSSAACVFGEARLISSTSRRLAKTGPGRNSNSFVRWSKTLTPVTSDGSRSGVNCMRENEQSSERASAFASIVFPTPGKSSMIRWPSLRRQRAARRSVPSGAWTTRARLSTMRPTTSEACAVLRACCCLASTPLPENALGLVEDGTRDARLCRLGNLLLGSVRSQDHHFIFYGVEADVG